MLRTTFTKSAGMLCRLSAVSASRFAAVTAIPSVRLATAVASSRAWSVNTTTNYRQTGIRFYSAGPQPLTNEFVFERISALLQSFDKVSDVSKITPEASFSSDLGLDSLDVVEVVLAIEEEFSIEIPDHEADEIKTVGQAVEYILKQPDAL